MLVADDDSAMASMLADGLGDLGYDVTTATDAAAAMKLVADPAVDVVVTDLRMPEVDGIELLAASKRAAPERPVLVMTAFGAIDTAVESLRKGAHHYLLKPFKVAELDLFIKRALEEVVLRQETRTWKRAFGDRYGKGALIAASDAMQEVRELTLRVADAGVSVLLTGETGTGKGLVARFLHAQSRRASGPFVPVNCAALPDNLLESELFGHVKGAFTGAVANRSGLFVEADGGTLFLDEIGDMAPSLQAKLLDVLERGAVRAVGATREREVDVRIVAATHRDLAERVASGQFREDLLYRLEGIAIAIPPLRQRKDDIPQLILRFVEEARSTSPGAVVERIGPEAMARLIDHPWPGNVRELQNAVARIVLLGRTPEAGVADLPKSITERPMAKRSAIDFGDEIIPVRELQRRYAAWALERAGGKKSLACEKLDIDVKTLNKWLASDERDD
ncbi:MAG: sigma-54-dependent Fis family transcriptional regulator [Labilithrix sp.]|nr:sigma-54-dependent Fis family transcriptional regulator [Labilithrix sp.]MCW5810537.1 sigma-54-dependent Fis family transcriptional regulator [Labilithrix sp.]